MPALLASSYHLLTSKISPKPGISQSIKMKILQGSHISADMTWTAVGQPYPQMSSPKPTMDWFVGHWAESCGPDCSCTCLHLLWSLCGSPQPSKLQHFSCSALEVCIRNFTWAQHEMALAHQHPHLPFLGGSLPEVARRPPLLVPVCLPEPFFAELAEKLLCALWLFCQFSLLSRNLATASVQ